MGSHILPAHIYIYHYPIILNSGANDCPLTIARITIAREIPYFITRRIYKYINICIFII